MTNPNQQHEAPARIAIHPQTLRHMHGHIYKVEDAEAGDILYARVDPPVAPEERAVARQNNFKIAKSIVRDWLMEKGVALTGVNGEVSYSTIQRFKLDLASRIVDALESAAKER